MNKRSLEVIRQIESMYSKGTYHNFTHAHDVKKALIAILSVEGYCLKQEGFAVLDAFGHDIGNGRKSKPYIDEYRAGKIMWDIGKNEGLCGEDLRDRYRNAKGTVFQERGNVQTYNQVYLNDADVSNIGASYHVFIENCAKLAIEQLPDKAIMNREYILSHFRETLYGFIPYLLDVSSSDSPFLSKQAAAIFPNFKQNRDFLQRDLEDYPDKLIDVVKKEWFRYYRVPLLNS